MMETSPRDLQAAKSADVSTQEELEVGPGPNVTVEEDPHVTPKTWIVVFVCHFDDILSHRGGVLTTFLLQILSMGYG